MSELDHGIAVDERYRLRRVLGAGGMGTVYEAHDTVMGTSVALKLLFAHTKQRDRAVDRSQTADKLFLLTARAATRVYHRAVVKVLDFGVDAALGPWLTMPLLRGETLRERMLRQRQLPTKTTQFIAGEVFEGLDALHESGIVHRDMKPENIFLAKTPDNRVQPVILDLGVAAALDIDVKVTAGTPAYMAPEARRGVATEQSDIYSMGVIVFEMLTGQLPYKESDETRASTQATRPLRAPTPATLEDLRTMAPSVPQPLLRLVARCLSVEVDRRPRTVREVRTLLDGAAAPVRGTPSTGMPTLTQLKDHIVQIEAMIVYQLLFFGGLIAAALLADAAQMRFLLWLVPAAFLGGLRGVMRVMNPTSSVRNRLTWASVIGGVAGGAVGAVADALSGGLTGPQGFLIGMAAGSAIGGACGDWIENWGKDKPMDRGEAFDYLYARRTKAPWIANARLIDAALDVHIESYDKNGDGRQWYMREDLDRLVKTKPTQVAGAEKPASAPIAPVLPEARQDSPRAVLPMPSPQVVGTSGERLLNKGPVNKDLAEGGEPEVAVDDSAEDEPRQGSRRV